MAAQAAATQKRNKMEFRATLSPSMWMVGGWYCWKLCKMVTTILEQLKKFDLMKKNMVAWAPQSFS